jgi:UDP-N-acetylglucosamine 2-epimerase (non-hydrolysing)
MDRISVTGGDYFMLTMHRQENVDKRARLARIIGSLKVVCNEYDIPMIYPIHPRTRKMIGILGLDKELEQIDRLHLIEPIGYNDFLVLEKNARLILTDSGGVQEEACILNVPCVTLRDNTERPETVRAGKNLVVGVEKKEVLDGVAEMLGKDLPSDNPFGDGKTAERIMDILKK